MRLINVTPSVFLYFSIAIMVLLHFLLPVDKIITLPWNLLGIIPLTLGIVINLVAVKTLRNMKQQLNLLNARPRNTSGKP